MGKVCINCKAVLQKGKSAWGLCLLCYYYKKRNGFDRPFYIISGLRKEPLQICDDSQKAKPIPRWCIWCGSIDVYARQRCWACYRYFLRHKKDRPKFLTTKELKCSTCKKPLAHMPNHKKKAGMCTPCYAYKRRNRKSRPKRLWGVGPHGWCDCGQPAINLVEDIPVCKSCFEMEMSEY